MPQADRKDEFTYCRDGDGHKNPSPSQEVCAWCSGCGMTIPLRSFKVEGSSHPVQDFVPYLEDGRGLRQELKRLQEKIKEFDPDFKFREFQTPRANRYW